MSKQKKKSAKDKVPKIPLRMLAIKKNPKQDLESSESGKVRVVAEAAGAVVVYNDHSTPMDCRPMRHGESVQSRDQLIRIHPFGRRRYPVEEAHAFRWLGYEHVNV